MDLEGERLRIDASFRNHLVIRRTIFHGCGAVRLLHYTVNVSHRKRTASLSRTIVFSKKKEEREIGVCIQFATMREVSRIIYITSKTG